MAVLFSTGMLTNLANTLFSSRAELSGSMPSLVNMQYGEANSMMQQSNGLSGDIMISDVIYDSKTPIGAVLSQTPSAGTLLSADEDISVVVNPRIHIEKINARHAVFTMFEVPEEDVPCSLEFYDIAATGEINSEGYEMYDINTCWRVESSGVPASGLPWTLSVAQGREAIENNQFEAVGSGEMQYADGNAVFDVQIPVGYGFSFNLAQSVKVVCGEHNETYRFSSVLDKITKHPELYLDIAYDHDFSVHLVSDEVQDRYSISKEDYRHSKTAYSWDIVLTSGNDTLFISTFIPNEEGWYNVEAMTTESLLLTREGPKYVDASPHRTEEGIRWDMTVAKRYGFETSKISSCYITVCKSGIPIHRVTYNNIKDADFSQAEYTVHPVIGFAPVPKINIVDDKHAIFTFENMAVDKQGLSWWNLDITCYGENYRYAVDQQSITRYNSYWEKSFGPTESYSVESDITEDTLTVDVQVNDLFIGFYGAKEYKFNCADLLIEFHNDGSYYYSFSGPRLWVTYS